MTATVNPWTRFQKLLPRTGRYTITITEVLNDGTSKGTRRDGATVRVKGTSVTVSSKAWVENETIVGSAPALPEFTQYV